MDSIIVKAREFAREAHKAQKRKYTGEPYFVHLEEVAGMVERARLAVPVPAIAAAWLHDVIEDQGVPREMLAAEFGDEIARMVFDLSDTPPTPGLNGEDRKALDRARLASSCHSVQSIKCADMISNTSSIVEHDPGFAKVYLPQKAAMLAVLGRAHYGLKYYAQVTLRNAEEALLHRSIERVGTG